MEENREPLSAIAIEKKIAASPEISILVKIRLLL